MSIYSLQKAFKQIKRASATPQVVATLHDKKVESWRQEPEKNNEYNNVQRPNHWKARAKEV